MTDAQIGLAAILALMVGCSVAAYAIAKGRGAEPGLWVMVSFILGPLGLLLTFVGAKAPTTG